MAKLIAGLNDDSVNKKLTRLIGAGKPHERAFALLATKHLDDPKLLVAIRKEPGQGRGPARGRDGPRARATRVRAELRASRKPKTPRIRHRRSMRSARSRQNRWSPSS